MENKQKYNYIKSEYIRDRNKLNNNIFQLVPKSKEIQEYANSLTREKIETLFDKYYWEITYQKST